MTARQIYGGLAPTFQLPASAGTAGQYIQSTGEGTTVWAAGGGGGGGSGTVTSVTAGPYCEVSGTPTIAPVIGLNIIPAGTVGTNGQVLSATATANELAWIDQAAALSFTLPLSEAAGVVSLPIAGVWSTTNNTVQGSSATALEWGPDAAGVTQVKTGANITDSGSATIPNLRVVVAGTYAANDVVGSLDSGVTMTWVANPADGVTSITQGANIVVSTASPASAAVPNVSVAVAGSYTANDVVGSLDSGVTMSWVAPPASGGVSSVASAGTYITVAGTADVTVALDVPLPAINNNVLASTTAGVLSWVDPLAGLSATAPVALVAGVISLPISGVWSTTNNTVQGSSNTALVWGPDAAGVTSITAGANIVVSTASPASAAVPNLSVVVAGSYTANYVVGSTDSGTTMTWVAPGGGGSGTVTSVAAGPYCVASGSATAPIIGLNVASGSAGQILSATPTANGLAWINQPPTLSFTAPLVEASNVISLDVSGTPVVGDVMQYTAPVAPAVVGGLEWAAPTLGTVTSVSASGPFIICTGNTTAATVALNVAAPANNGDVLASTTAGVLSWITPPAAGVGTVTNVTATNPLTVATGTSTPAITLNLSNSFVNNATNQLALKASNAPAATYLLSAADANGNLTWVAPAAGGVTSIAQGSGIDVDNTTPTVPVISVAVRPNSFVTNAAGTSVDQVDLNVGACPTAGYVLSSSAGGGASGTAPVLTWIAPPAATLPAITFTSGVAFQAYLTAEVAGVETPVLGFTITVTTTGLGLSYTQLGSLIMIQPTCGITVTITSLGTVSGTATNYNLTLLTIIPATSSFQITDPIALVKTAAGVPTTTYLEGDWGTTATATTALSLYVTWVAGAVAAGDVYYGVVPAMSYSAV